MRRRATILSLAAAGGLTAALASACGAASTCPSGQTSLELDVGVDDPQARSQIQSVLVELTIDGIRARRLFDAGNQLEGGRIPVVVVIDMPLAVNGFADATILANSAKDGTGAVVAQGSQQLTLTENTCLRSDVDLSPLGGGGATPANPTNPTSPTNPNPMNPRRGGGSGDDQGNVAPNSACPSQVDDGTVAFFDFENAFSSGTISNRTGRSSAPDGRLSGSGFTSVPGPTGCGNALQFPDANGNSNGTAVGILSDHRSRGGNAYGLAKGSFDLWIMAPPAPYANRLTVMSRDVSTVDNGVALMLACDGTLVARIGRIGGTQFHQCSNAPVASGAWRHVVINFGAPGLEMSIDGVTQTRTDAIGLADAGCTTMVTCGTSTTTGIDVGTSPWVLGADGVDANPGTLTPVTEPFLLGGIDELRISRVRR